MDQVRAIDLPVTSAVAVCYGSSGARKSAIVLESSIILLVLIPESDFTTLDNRRVRRR